MDKFITGIILVVLFAPFLWPAFVMVYRYFRDLGDQRFQQRQDTADREVRTGTRD